MVKPLVTDNPDVLANVITGLGGSVIPGPTFKFYAAAGKSPRCRAENQ